MKCEEMPAPRLDEAADYRDAGMAVIRPRFAGFCGTDRGIWFRRAMKDMIYDSLAQEHRDVDTWTDLRDLADDHTGDQEL